MTRKATFMSLVIKLPGRNACWNWNGHISTSGYGRFWDGTKTIPAHWYLLASYPPSGLEACHKCDNRACVRPSHIFIGTRSENMMDCSKKGRLMANNRKGLDHPNGKLSNHQVERIRTAPRIRGEATRLAKEMGVSLVCVCDIRDGKRR